MKIYKMTATFGKLRHAELTFEPGLNIIEAPNEWGKSTWCAFMLAMFYGMDTRARTTKGAIADKERYVPWSGELMSGRIDLCWKGRDITIERSTRRRVPLGEFKAYETASGMPVAELTAENCGEWLLGVEQAVFRRAGFIRFSDLPVTQDEALRTRLNALVTTGDDSGEAERLAEELRDLRNRCRYNKKGLIPQAEEELAALEGKLRELEEQTEVSVSVGQQLEALEKERKDHERHLAAMDYKEAQEDARQVDQAREAMTEAEARLAALEERTGALPTPEETLAKLMELEDLTRALERQELLPELTAPEAPVYPAFYGSEDPRAAVERDRAEHKKLSRGPLLFWIAAGVLAVAGGVLAGLMLWIAAVGVIGLGALVLAAGLTVELKRREKKMELERRYGMERPENWLLPLEKYEEALASHGEALRGYEEALALREKEGWALQDRRERLCGELTPERAIEVCHQIRAIWAELEEARRDLRIRRENHAALKEMAKIAPAPDGEDLLECTREESRERLSRLEEERWSAQNRMGRCQGRMQSLGSREALEQERQEVQARLRVLEDAYAALTIAQETLAQAKLELQRRFAPQIVKRAKELMEQLTCGRYDKLGLKEDLTITAGAGEEDVIRDILWRSDGTVDQLYLALRLAVAEALAPDAPLILDDALVRFDDVRLKAALQVLKDCAEDRQVLIFTCHSRERSLLDK